MVSLASILLFPMDPIARTMILVPLVAFGIILLCRYVQDYLNNNPDLFDAGAMTLPLRAIPTSRLQPVLSRRCP